MNMNVKASTYVNMEITFHLLGERQKCQNPEQVNMQPSGDAAAQLQSPVWGMFSQMGFALQKSVTLHLQKQLAAITG